MGTGKILPTLVTLGLPAAAGGVMQTLFEVADTLFVSRLGKEQISGVSVVGPLFFFCFSVSTAISVGVSALLARRPRHVDARLAPGSSVPQLAGVEGVSAVSGKDDVLRGDPERDVGPFPSALARAHLPGLRITPARPQDRATATHRRARASATGKAIATDSSVERNACFSVKPTTRGR